MLSHAAFFRVRGPSEAVLQINLPAVAGLADRVFVARAIRAIVARAILPRAAAAVHAPVVAETFDPRPSADRPSQQLCGHALVEPPAPVPLCPAIARSPHLVPSEPPSLVGLVPIALAEVPVVPPGQPTVSPLQLT